MASNTTRPSKPGFYFVDSPEMRAKTVSHVVQVQENGNVYAIGVAGSINWPPHMLQNWRRAVDELGDPPIEQLRGARTLVEEACKKLCCGGGSLLTNLDRLLTDVGKYDRLRRALREAMKGDPSDAELRNFYNDLRDAFEEWG